MYTVKYVKTELLPLLVIIDHKLIRYSDHKLNLAKFKESAQTAHELI